MRRDWMPLPTPEQMLAVLGIERFAPAIEAAFRAEGVAIVEGVKDAGLLSQGDRVLELGCGCGGLARALLDEPIGSYLGLDAREDLVAWCAREFPPRDPRFAFQAFEGGLVRGAEGGVELRSPFPDDAFDLVLAAGAFDRMPPEHVAAYLRELGRVVAPEGRVVLRVFLAVGRTYSDPGRVYHEPKALWRLVEDAGFEHRLREAPRTGVVPNWLALRSRKPAGSRSAAAPPPASRQSAR